MKFIILFSPSEDKIIVDNNFLKENNMTISTYFLESLWKNEALNNHRLNIMKHYYKALSMILERKDKTMLKSIYGAKSFNDKNIFDLCAALHSKKLLKAIELYNGVAFQGISFNTLPQYAKDFILENVLIFSNLFGVIRANDSIPYYKLKQGTKEKNLTLKDIYAPFILPLQQTIQTKEYIIDLRSGIYTKIFKPNIPHFFFEFQKNGKIISHYSKLYRGIILRLISQEECNMSIRKRFDYFCSLHDANFRFHSYKQKDNYFTLRYEILS